VVAVIENPNVLVDGRRLRVLRKHLIEQRRHAF
jgi:hypothetical protein